MELGSTVHRRRQVPEKMRYYARPYRVGSIGEKPQGHAAKEMHPESNGLNRSWLEHIEVRKREVND